uniref:Uncharacterized protein n=1 Tax=Tanacetum cinerariifolium TaxID=118510 RepID=A0A6L2LNM5_TANCI|nr:hypothetical protein [Tanacetum cinerariifolium]
MSTKAAHTKSKTKAAHMSTKAAHTKSKTEVSQTKSDLFLDQLEVDVTGTIVVMIGRMWYVNDVTGRYLSTDFIVSVAMGGQLTRNQVPGLLFLLCQPESLTFHCKVRIENFRTKKGWNYPLCGSDACKKGIIRKGGEFWYRLELDVSEKTAHVVVVMFDETTTELAKYPAESILEVGDEVRL